MIDVIFGQQLNLMTLVIAGLFGLLLAVMWTRRGSLDCVDIITSPDGRLSRTAIGQTFGIVVAIWSPVYTTLDGKLQAEVLAISLAYLGFVEGYAKYLRFKQDMAGKSGGGAS
jgi:hypothetical protein